MINRNKFIFPIIVALILYFPIMALSQNCYDYNNTTDKLQTKITLNNKLHSKFFNSHETSYPWYIFKHYDGTFESAIDEEITEKDKIPIENNSNCFSTHQGKHIMDFCDATYDSGVLRLEIYGGMPAYSSSLMITVKDLEFLCYFKAAYPAPVFNCKWNILSKKLVLKNKEILKGKRIYAWVFVEFEETSTYQGKTTTNKYKIEGYLKPVVK
jgi:hypothetical protein